jgi:gamma-glutamyltranspeptidase
VLSVVDQDGNMVSLIKTTSRASGSGVVAGGTGFPLQNRGAFPLDRSHPNVLATQAPAAHDYSAFMRRGARAKNSATKQPSASWARGIILATRSLCRTSSTTANIQAALGRASRS